MRRDAVEIKTPDGVADGYVIGPERSGSWPGVIFLTDIGGIREQNIPMAERVAAEGYVVLMPNVFYRFGKPPVFDFNWPMGGPEMMKRFGELRTPLTPEAIARDELAFVDFLAAQDGVAAGPLGAVGYCFSGSHAIRAAAARPDKIGAAASFHGGGLHTDQPDSPHLLLPQIKADLYFGHAVEDRSMNAQAIAGFESALGAWGGNFESEIYEGALHGWTVPGRASVYNHAQAERAFGKLRDFFGATLK